MSRYRFLFPPLLLISLLGACSDDISTPTFTAEQLQQLRSQSDTYSGLDIDRLQSDSGAMALGQTLLAAHCDQCHGENAPGLRDITNLQTGIFDYGDTADAIRTTISAGRHSLMPALGSVLGEVELGGLVAYVRSFNSGETPEDFLERSKEIYATHCVVCHGIEARGNPELGSANLTDSYWQHGDSMMNVRLTITRGVESVCPAQEGVLSAAEMELLTAYILQLRDTKD
ncbi:MAG: c-type cytochrome [Pseudomonadota bacterium]